MKLSIKQKSGLNNQGFTLVELMVVVGIIGVLASVAIPQYSRFTARAKQSEVKVMLGTARTAIEAYRPENGLTTCLNIAGYAHPTATFYAVGWNNMSPGSFCGLTSPLTACPAASLQPAAPVAGACYGRFSNTKNDGAAFAALTPAAGVITSGTAYTIGATGMVKAGLNDSWTISQDGVFVNTASGI